MEMKWGWVVAEAKGAAALRAHSVCMWVLVAGGLPLLGPRSWSLRRCLKWSVTNEGDV